MEYKSFLLIDSHNQQKKNFHFVLLFVCLNKKKNEELKHHERRITSELGKCWRIQLEWRGGSKYMLAHEHSRQTTIEATNTHTHTHTIDNINANLNIIFYRCMSKEFTMNAMKQGVAK